MNMIQIKGCIGTGKARRLLELMLVGIVLVVSACSEDHSSEPITTSAVTAEPTIDEAKADSQDELKQKLELEQQELIDMNQRKAELETEIQQIKQAIGEADLAIQQKEQELQKIRQATGGQADS